MNEYYKAIRQDGTTEAIAVLTSKPDEEYDGYLICEADFIQIRDDAVVVSHNDAMLISDDYADWTPCQYDDFEDLLEKALLILAVCRAQREVDTIKTNRTREKGEFVYTARCHDCEHRLDADGGCKKCGKCLGFVRWQNDRSSNAPPETQNRRETGFEIPVQDVPRQGHGLLHCH